MLPTTGCPHSLPNPQRSDMLESLEMLSKLASEGDLVSPLSSLLPVKDCIVSAPFSSRIGGVSGPRRARQDAARHAGLQSSSE